MAILCYLIIPQLQPRSSSEEEPPEVQVRTSLRTTRNIECEKLCFIRLASSSNRQYWVGDQAHSVIDVHLIDDITPGTIMAFHYQIQLFTDQLNSLPLNRFPTCQGRRFLSVPPALYKYSTQWTSHILVDRRFLLLSRHGSDVRTLLIQPEAYGEDLSLEHCRVGELYHVEQFPDAYSIFKHPIVFDPVSGRTCFPAPSGCLAVLDFLLPRINF
jgi:hypothetical protein